jgi:hypothetical protein
MAERVRGEGRGVRAPGEEERDMDGDGVLEGGKVGAAEPSRSDMSTSLSTAAAALELIDAELVESDQYMGR